MTVVHRRIHGRHGRGEAGDRQRVGARKRRGRTRLAAGHSRRARHEELLRAFALGVPVVGALRHQIDFFPGVETDVVDDERVRDRVPAQSVRIPETIRVDFRFQVREAHGHERIRIRSPRRDSIASVRAEVIVGPKEDVRGDPQDLALERVEPLRDGVGCASGFSRCAVADGNVQVPVVRMTELRQRVEDRIAQRVNVAGKSHAEDFACGSLEGAVGDVRVDPLDEHSLAHHRACGRTDDRGRYVACAQIESRQAGVGRNRRRALVRILQVHRVERAGRRIVGSEGERDEAGGETRRIVESREDFLEVEIRAERLVRLAQDVQVSIRVADEEPRRQGRRARGLRAQEVDARELAGKVDRRWIGARRHARERQAGVVLQHHGGSVFRDLWSRRVLRGEAARAPDHRTQHADHGQPEHGTFRSRWPCGHRSSASLWTLRSADMTAERRPPLKRDDERPRVRLGGGRETWIMKCCAVVCNQNHAAAAA